MMSAGKSWREKGWQRGKVGGEKYGAGKMSAGFREN